MRADTVVRPRSRRQAPDLKELRAELLALDIDRLRTRHSAWQQLQRFQPLMSEMRLRLRRTIESPLCGMVHDLRVMQRNLRAQVAS